MSESSSAILRFGAPEVGSGFHANTAVDGENRAGHIGAASPTEKQDGTCYVLGPAQAPQGNALFDAPHAGGIPCRKSCHTALEEAGRQGVYGDPACRQLL